MLVDVHVGINGKELVAVNAGVFVNMGEFVCVQARVEVGTLVDVNVGVMPSSS